MLKVYELLWKILLPLVHASVRARSNNGKEDAERVGERYGDASVERPEGELFWVHAASVGETMTALTFIKRIKPLLNNDCSFLITTNTVSSADLLAEENIDGVIHQYIPLDYKPYVKKFFKHWRPKYAFFFESELWPTLINECTADHIFLINGRLSDRSFQRWKYLKSFMKSILSRFSIIMTQTKEDANRFSYFLEEKVVYTGNIKYSNPKLKVDNDLLDKLKLATRKYVFVAASTHEGEERELLNAYESMCKKLGKSNVSFVIIPRHPIRAPKVCELVKQYGHSVCLRSRLQNVPSDVICVDTFGEMGSFFSIADFVFVGGSLTHIGGHNILEPILFQKPVMYGPHMFNFREMRALLEQAKVGFEVTSASQMTALFIKYISNKRFHNQISDSLAKLDQEDPMKNVILRLKEFCGFTTESM